MHTFVICAYKESDYLRDCILSLKNQSIRSEIICATSTPNDYISSICNEYGIPLYINAKQQGIAADWNFALSKAKTQYVTLAHQDDIYEPEFLEETLKMTDKCPDPLIAFTDYYEIREGKKIVNNKLLLIKRIMSAPWRFGIFKRSRLAARSIFMFGTPICCPSVTFNLEAIKKRDTGLFNSDYKTNCDWLAWIEIRDEKGEFLYCPKKLMGHRIHIDSETSNGIADKTRSREDFEILRMLAPKPIARAVHYFYVRAQISNKA